MSKRPNAPRRDQNKTMVLGYIHPGEVSAYFTQSLIGTLLYDRANDQRITGIFNEWSSANVSNARNKVVAKFLDESDAAWLLFLDADMAWEVNAPHQLLAVASKENAPVVGGLCFGSGEDRLFPTIYQMAEKDGEPITMRLLDYPDETMFRCTATGAAFVLIHRDVLVAMRERSFNNAFLWFQETSMAGMPCGEDITFCLRAGLLGFPVHVHTGVHIGHHKSQVLTHEMFQAQKGQP